MKDLTAQERLKVRQVSLKPLVDACFMWVRQNVGKILGKSKTFQYSLNQETYRKVFLSNGEVPLDNNAAEQSIRNFCIGKKSDVY